MYKKILTFLLMNTLTLIVHATDQTSDLTHGHENNLIRIFRISENEQKYDAAYELWKYGSSSDQDYVRPFLFEIARDRNSEHRYEAAALLWEKGIPEDKENIIEVLLEIAKRSDGWNLVSNLKDNKDILIAITQADSNQFRYEAAEKLLKKGTEADKRISIPRLMQFSHTEFGWNRIATNIANNQDLLRQIAKTQLDHPHKKDALLLLWKNGTEEERAEIHTLLMTNDNPSNHHPSYTFCSKINSSLKKHFLEQDASISLLNEIFSIENHIWRNDAAVALWNKQNPENKEIIKAFLIDHASRIKKDEWTSDFTSFINSLQHQREILVAISKTPNHPFQCEAIEKLYKSEDENDKQLALSFFIEYSEIRSNWENIKGINEKNLFASVAKIENHPFQYNAAKILWTSNQMEFKAIALSTIIQTAQTQNNPYKYDAIEILRQSKDLNDQEIATSLWCRYSQTEEGWNKIVILYEKEKHSHYTYGKKVKDIFVEILKIQNHPYHYEAAKILWELREENDCARPILTAISQTLNHLHRYDATKLLWDSYNDGDRDNAKISLIETARTAGDPNQYDALEQLRLSYNDTDHETAIPLWYNYAKTPQGWDNFLRIVKEEFTYTNRKETLKKILGSILSAEDHPHQFDAAEKLWDLTFKDAARQFFYNIIEGEQNHPRYYDAVIKVWLELNRNKMQNAAKIQSIINNFKIMMDTPNHPHRYDASLHLWNNLPLGEDKNKAKTIIIEIANTQGHPHRYEAAVQLWVSSYDQDAARPAITEIARIPHDPHRYDAAVHLWRSRFDQPTARPIIREIAYAEGHPNQQDAIKALRESNDQGDQELGRELKLRFFPVELRPETILKRNQFDLSAIREMMPQRLPDLSDDQMDIVAEIRNLINLISSDELTASGQPNSYYLDPKTITGPDAHYTLEEIKNRTFGLLKTLAGQPLSAGETRGWKMYEESKPDMINTIKHLIYAIKGKLSPEEHLTEYDPQGALLNLGIVLNGLLYCPTGQAEGLQTAINTLINFKNIQSSDVREKIGRTVFAKVVIDTFNLAFYKGGDVHGISRARMVLNPELNISNALPAFKERISPPAEQERPEFYNAFYKLFTPANILSEFHRNFQTPEEHEYISTHSSLDARRKKEQKPLHLGQIIEWLLGHGISEQEMHENFDISRDFNEITDYGIMQFLIKMNFFRKDSEEFIQYMRIISDRRINQLNERALKEEERARQKLEREQAIAKEHQSRPPLTQEEVRAARIAKLAPPSQRSATK